MKMYRVVKIIAYGAWGDVQYGDTIKIFSTRGEAERYLDDNYQGWREDSWRSVAIKEENIEKEE